VDTKAAQARKFLEHNDKVQITVMFRGREMQHVEEGRRVLDSLLQKLADVGKVERPPAMDGKRMNVMLMPLKAPAKGGGKPKAPSPKQVAGDKVPVAKKTAEAPKDAGGNTNEASVSSSESSEA
jgi:translation initiation factor IF-3